MKKFILSALALVTVAVVSITGTIAYLQDEKSDVNVMTLGDVKIEQLEYERVLDENGNPVKGVEGVDFDAAYDITESYKLQPFTRNKPAYPAVYQNGKIAWDEFQQLWNGVGAPGSNELFDDSMKNVIDKFVFVKNAGTTDAYYRTYIAIEWPDGLSDKAIHVNFNTNTRFTRTNLGAVMHEGVRYYVYEMLYNEILTPGEVSRPSLLQVYLDPTVTNEDCALFGETWEIIALSQAVQAAGFENANQALTSTAVSAAKVALDTSFGKPMDKYVDDTYVSNVVAWLNGAQAKYEASLIDTWDGTADTSWYNNTDSEFVITTAEQLAGLAELVDDGNTFDDQTVKLGRDLDLKVIGDDGEAICFDPIGSYRNDKSFKGTFDGQGYTIKNLNQNTWALNNGYDYGDLGLGLFGKVKDATVKNLIMDGASISGESAICGTIAGCAYGNMTFENITVKNANVNDYQYYAGGIVGWASGNHTYKNINIDASTTIGGQWGDFGNANGGIVGGIGGSAVIHFEDCTVACRIDAVNDVVSAYQWKNYRNSGMLVGSVPQAATNGEVQTVATPKNVTCKNVTVIYNDWANYTYCEFTTQLLKPNINPNDYPYVRVQAGVSVDAYSNIRYGQATDANHNTVVDDNHVHNAGEAHHELIVFDQLFGGPADHRYCYYGINAFDGVKVVYNNK